MTQDQVPENPGNLESPENQKEQQQQQHNQQPKQHNQHKQPDETIIDRLVDEEIGRSQKIKKAREYVGKNRRKLAVLDSYPNLFNIRFCYLEQVQMHEVFFLIDLSGNLQSSRLMCCVDWPYYTKIYGYVVHCVLEKDFEYLDLNNLEQTSDIMIQLWNNDPKHFVEQALCMNETDRNCLLERISEPDMENQIERPRALEAFIQRL